MMKSALVFTISMIISGFSFSQVFTIDVFEVQSLNGYGESTLEEVISEPGSDGPIRSVNCRYVFDFTKGTSAFYRDNLLISEIPINVNELSSGVYSIKAQDTDLETGTRSMETTIYLDTDLDSGKFLYMYYDPISENTSLDVITKYTIVRPV